MNNQNNNQPMMGYPAPSNHLYTDVDDITRPIAEGQGAPTVNSIPDPYLQDEGFYDDWDNKVQEVQEGNTAPALPTLPDNRRLS